MREQSAVRFRVERKVRQCVRGDKASVRDAGRAKAGKAGCSTGGHLPRPEGHKPKVRESNRVTQKY